MASSGSSTAMTGTESWDNLKGYSYDQRSDFAAKATEYANRLDTRVATAKGTASTKLTEARDELRSAATQASQATADTWDATKDRVGAAWQKADMAVRSAAE
jgi:hypothetical protein